MIAVCAGVSPPRAACCLWGRQYAQGPARAQASGGPEDTPQPAPFRRLRLSDRHPPCAVGYLSPLGRFRAGPSHRRARLAERTCLVSAHAASVPAPGLVLGAWGHRRGGLCLPRPCGADPTAGVLGCDGPAPDLEVRPWEGAQSPRHPCATQAVDPDADAHGQHPTSSDLWGLCPMMDSGATLWKFGVWNRW